jgi:DeoR/GlpR family transcriptional regulator of sugar metabolism
MDSMGDKLHAGKMAKLDTRLNALIEVFRKEPNVEITEAARRIQVSRQTVYSYLSILEKAGRIKRGENGIEVLG